MDRYWDGPTASTMTMPGLSPLHASDSTRFLILDIRPRYERYGGLGFIAGSVSVPMPSILRSDITTVERLSGPRRPVLICTTGLWAHRTVRALTQVGEISLDYVLGGLLAWHDDALPLAGRRETQPPVVPSTLAQLRMQLYELLDELLAEVPIELRAPPISSFSAAPASSGPGWRTAPPTSYGCCSIASR